MAGEDIPILGGTASYKKAIRAAFAKYPGWYVRAARVSKVEVTRDPEVREQVAVYEHDTRILHIYDGVGSLLQKAIGHELAHGCDDNFGCPHYFTATAEWNRIHREQPHFDIAKYRDEPLEYFADMVTKMFLVGPDKLRITNGREVTFILGWVFPLLQKEFGP